MVDEELVVGKVEGVVEDGLVEAELDAVGVEEWAVEGEGVTDLGCHGVAGAFFGSALGDGWAVGVAEADADGGAGLGLPVHPEWYSDQFDRLRLAANLRKIRLHALRHTALSLMEKARVPISIISKWAGHYDAAFTMKTYVHANDDDLKLGTRSLAKIHKIA